MTSYDGGYRQTDFGLKELHDTIHWDGKKSSSYWDQFDQVTDEKTGQPKVMCKRCFSVLVHILHDQRHDDVDVEFADMQEDRAPLQL
ncbi:hypothetical protein BDW66DRAFT_155945 [Aspergillus desertorum]